jgi:hypothetical protein
MDLTGLSPEQIAQIGQTDLGYQGLALDAAKALGTMRAYDERTAAQRAAAYDPVYQVRVDGQVYPIRQSKMQVALGHLLKHKRETDFEIMDMNGKPVEVKRDQLPAMYTAQSRAARVPAQNMADRAQAGYYEQAGERQAAEANLTDQEINKLQTQRHAIESLGGKSMKDVLDDPQTLAKIGPGTLATALNRKSEKEPVFASPDVNFMTKTFERINDKDKTVGIGEVSQTNQIAIETNNSPTMATMTEDGAVEVPLPVGVTPRIIAERARAKGVTVEQYLEALYKRISK